MYEIGDGAHISKSNRCSTAMSLSLIEFWCICKVHVQYIGCFFLLGKVQGRIIFFQVLYLIWGKYCAVSWRFFGGAVVVILFYN